LLVVVGGGVVAGIGIGIGSEAARRDFFDERLGLIQLCKEKKS
jgi:ribonuclease D